MVLTKESHILHFVFQTFSAVNLRKSIKQQQHHDHPQPRYSYSAMSVTSQFLNLTSKLTNEELMEELLNVTFVAQNLHLLQH
jgi:hypothetical protein